MPFDSSSTIKYDIITAEALSNNLTSVVNKNKETRESSVITSPNDCSLSCTNTYERMLKSVKTSCSLLDFKTKKEGQFYFHAAQTFHEYDQKRANVMKGYYHGKSKGV